MQKCKNCFHKNVCGKIMSNDSFWKQSEITEECYDYCEITDKYNNMITAFTGDFFWALEDKTALEDLNELIKSNDKTILEDINLLSELEFNLRHGQLKIIK